MNFFLRCIPPTASHHSKRIVRIGRFSRLADTERLVTAKETIDTLLMAYRPASPLTGAVSLTLDYTWPWRASDAKRLRALGRIPRSTRPDCSNLAKTTEDRLVALRFLEDDGQVVELIVRKWFGDEPGIGVTITSFIVLHPPHTGLESGRLPRPAFGPAAFAAIGARAGGFLGAGPLPQGDGGRRTV